MMLASTSRLRCLDRLELRYLVAVARLLVGFVLAGGGMTRVQAAPEAGPKAAAAPKGQVAARPSASPQATAPDEKLYAVDPPPFSEGIFPCSECHTDPPNMTRRELTDEHTAIKLNHGPRERWCFDCHNPPDRDQLRLASGTLVPFTRSYLLCGQCHGDKLRDWRVGVHGQRTGMWNGAKHYLLCANCHNPHSPRFKALKPLPPPVSPAGLRRR